MKIFGISSTCHKE